MRTLVRRYGAVFLVALASLPLRAQEAAPQAAQLREDIRILELFQRLRLTRDQGQAILERLPAIQERLGAIAEAERRMYLEAQAAVVKLEWQMIRDEPLDGELRKLVKDAWTRCNRARDEANKHIDTLVGAIRALLGPEQQALIESQADQAKREAEEAVREAARQKGVQVALDDLNQWVRTAAREEFARDRTDKVMAAIAAAYPGVDVAELGERPAQLAQLYDQVRTMEARDFNRMRPRLAAQLSTVLAPYVPGGAQTSVLSTAEWRALWTNPRTAELLHQLVAGAPAAGDGQ